MTKCDRLVPQKCGYEWKSKSEMYYVTCPKCHKTVKIREFKEVTKNETVSEI